MIEIDRASTRGGRSGALPELVERMLPSSVLLPDDAARPDEQRILARWAHEFGVHVDMLGSARNAFALVSMPEKDEAPPTVDP